MPARFWASRAALAALIAVAGTPVLSAALIIDNFSALQEVRVQNASSNINTSSLSSASLLGGNREFFLQRDAAVTNGVNNNNGVLLSQTNVLSLTTHNNHRTRATITYDGSGGGDTITNSFNATPNQFQLDEDMISAGLDPNLHKHGNQITFTFSSNALFPLTLTFYNATGTQFVSRTHNIPVGTNTTANFLFSSFTGTGTPETVFNQVGAIVLSLGSSTFTSPNGASPSISYFAVTGTPTQFDPPPPPSVPEPGTMGLAGLTLVGVGVVGRRRNRNK